GDQGCGHRSELLERGRCRYRLHAVVYRCLDRRRGAHRHPLIGRAPPLVVLASPQNLRRAIVPQLEAGVLSPFLRFRFRLARSEAGAAGLHGLATGYCRGELRLPTTIDTNMPVVMAPPMLTASLSGIRPLRIGAPSASANHGIQEGISRLRFQARLNE